MITQAAAFLRDLTKAWEHAAPEERNALARLVFASVELVADQVVAVVQQPDSPPFFVARATTEGMLEDNKNGR